MKLTRRQFLLSTSLGVTGTVLSSCMKVQHSGGRSSKTPNVLVIKSDEHNPRYTGPYGHPFVKTPNMDRLAARGTVYEHSYCNSPLCLPSRSSFMAGRYPFEIQTPNNCNAFSFDYPTHGRLLSEHGVYTVLVGKVDVYNHSSTLGFDEVILPKDRTPPGDLNISRDPLAIREGASERQYGYGADSNMYAHDSERVDAAVNWIRTKGVSLDRPWYLEVNVGAPHFPHFVTEEMWDYYKEHADLPTFGVDAETARHPYMQDLRKHFELDAFSEESVRGLRRGYYGAVNLVDRHIGRLIDSVEDTWQLDNTVVMYTSDHGEMLGKFGLWWKCCLLEDSARVPLIVAGPGFEPNRRFRACVDQLDVQATLFDLFGVRMPSIRRGRSLVGRRDDYDHTVVFAEYQGHGTRGSAFMVRKGDFKYIWYHAAPAQLFNLKEDPEELENLAGRLPKKLAEMDRHLRNFCNPEAEQRRTEVFIQQQLIKGRAMKEAHKTVQG